MAKTGILLIDCPDRKGIVAAVSDFLYRHDANILHADQHQDSERGLFLMRVEWELDGFNLDFVLSVLKHSVLPVLSLVMVGLGGWFMGMRALVSNIVNEDYVVYAELGGVARGRILRSYVMRNALVPQVTGLAMSLGGIFNGAIITEQVFGYPGIGSLLVDAVHAGDYSLVLGLTSVSIVAVSAAVLLLDMLYPLLDPRVKVG